MRFWYHIQPYIDILNIALARIILAILDAASITSTAWRLFSSPLDIEDFISKAATYSQDLLSAKSSSLVEEFLYSNHFIVTDFYLLCAKFLLQSDTSRRSMLLTFYPSLCVYTIIRVAIGYSPGQADFKRIVDATMGLMYSRLLAGEIYTEDIDKRIAAEKISTLLDSILSAIGVFPPGVNGLEHCLVPNNTFVRAISSADLLFIRNFKVSEEVEHFKTLVSTSVTIEEFIEAYQAMCIPRSYIGRSLLKSAYAERIHWLGNVNSGCMQEEPHSVQTYSIQDSKPLFMSDEPCWPCYRASKRGDYGRTAMSKNTAMSHQSSGVSGFNGTIGFPVVNVKLHFTQVSVTSRINGHMASERLEFLEKENRFIRKHDWRAGAAMLMLLIALFLPLILGLHYIDVLSRNQIDLTSLMSLSLFVSAGIIAAYKEVVLTGSTWLDLLMLSTTVMTLVTTNPKHDNVTAALTYALDTGKDCSTLLSSEGTCALLDVNTNIGAIVPRGLTYGQAAHLGYIIAGGARHNSQATLAVVKLLTWQVNDPLAQSMCIILEAEMRKGDLYSHLTQHDSGQNIIVSGFDSSTIYGMP
ncbi:hypothetical protein K450DRAFT_201891 [Umbelopsis ramanniana AG]|uniref:Uncharacterized protein n=1 Tax=Umbelopsis ramanniana AG TaxID=1314678 RepID=A0AAD5HBJ0_UMBRA|nr:uncharacterized protein K450DRAFT_201891 [Umbelopsis ramanniana AG]KAI8576556.1 hypothetical protein K450DRAFT_201891 [Umbelopsis ramanniana AG]